MKKYLYILFLFFSVNCFAGGSRDYIPANSDNIDIGDRQDASTAITLMGWFYGDTQGGNQNADIICKRASVGSQPYISYSLRYAGSSVNVNPSFNVGISGTLRTTGNNTHNELVGQWAFYAGTWSTGNSLKFYLEGVLENESSAFSGSITYNAYNVLLGRNALDGVTLDGKAAYLQIHSSVLSSAQIAETMWKPGLVANGIYGFFPLWGSDATEEDLSGKEYHGTVNGADESSFGPPVFFMGGV